MADTGTIPSSAEEPQVGINVLPSDLIPGSDVQKVTALRQGTVPAPALQRTTMSRVGDALAIIGANLGDISRPTGAGLKTIEYIRGVQSDMQSRAAMGYIARLHNFAMQNPSRARDAMSDLNDFLATNAENIPLPIQIAAEQVAKNMQGIAQTNLARQVVMGIGAEGGPQIEFAGRYMRAYPDADPNFIIALSKEMPKNPSKILGPNPVTGEYFKVTELPSGDVTMTKMQIEGYEPVGKGAEQFDKLDEWTRRAIFKHMGDVNATPPHALMMGVLRGEPKAMTELAVREAEGRGLKATETAKEAEVRGAETERRERAMVDYKQTLLTEKQTSDLQEFGVYRGQKRISDVKDGDWEAIRKGKLNQQSAQEIRRSLAEGQTFLVDDALNRLPVNSPEQIETAIQQASAGRAYRVTPVQYERIGTMAAMSETVRRYNAIVSTILTDRAYTPGTTIGQMIKLISAGQFGRGTITGEDAGFMLDMQGELGLRISKALTNTARSNYMGQQASKMLAGPKDTVELASKKTTFLRSQFVDAIAFELGKPEAQNWRLSAKDVVAAIPELRGQIHDEFDPGTGKPATFGTAPETTVGGRKINWGPLGSPSRKPPQER